MSEAAATQRPYKAAPVSVDLLKLAGDRGQIDAITGAQCPQVRDGALYALEIPDLASALIGF